MHISLYDPWQLVGRRLQQDARRMTGVRAADSAAWVPAVDIREESDRFVIDADVPGLNADDLDIMMENGDLTIRGSRRLREGEPPAAWKRTERVSGSFERRFGLPETADTESISADYRAGVLTVTILKRAAAQPRRIAVN